MKNNTVFHIVWILVGCIFAEAAFMFVQVALSVLTSPQSYSLHEMLSVDNPFYQIPPHYFLVGIVFILAIIYGEIRKYYNISYYICAAFIAALIYLASLWLSGFALTPLYIIINLAASVVSGAVYWAVTPRRFNRQSLSTF